MVNAKTITVDSGESRAQLYAELMKLSRGGSGASDHSFRAGASRFRIDVDGLHACSKILTVLPTTLAYKIDHRTAPNELLGAFSSTTTVTSTGLWLADAVFIMERLVDFSVPGGGELRMRIEANGGEKTKVITFKSECKEVEGTLGNGIPYAWVPATLTIGEEQNPVTRRRLIPVQFMSGTEPDHALDANISHLI
ncbi:MAG: hypothetical protein KGH50_03080, partial [Candidatus Micrarchaeota archaeon]|nr:hypothetical protein [Candidatus Micrarchaeota archaeon]